MIMSGVDSHLPNDNIELTERSPRISGGFHVSTVHT